MSSFPILVRTPSHPLEGQMYRLMARPAARDQGNLFQVLWVTAVCADDDVSRCWDGAQMWIRLHKTLHHLVHHLLGIVEQLLHPSDSDVVS